MITPFLALLLLSSPDGVAPPPVPPSPATMTIDAAGVLEQVKRETGKLVVVNFWASFCLPCLVELPALLQLRDELGKEAAFVFVSFDAPEDSAHAQVLLKRRKINMISSFSSTPPEAWRSAFPEWDGSVPHTVVFGRDGTLLLEIDGELDAKLFAAQLKALAAQRRKP
jgi:thiol-disulfide isomerase/thioredoxin